MNGEWMYRTGHVPDSSLHFGLVSGTVRENYDKNEPGKVKVEYYLGEEGRLLTGWIPVMTPYTADKAGIYLLPEIGTEVVIGFLGGRLDCPVVLGSLWCKDSERPEQAVQEKNLTKVIRTKGGHEIRFSDEEKKQKLTVTTPGGLTVSLEDEGEVLRLHDKDKKNLLVIDGKKGECEIKADKKLVLSVGDTKAELSGSKLTLKSASVDGQATQSMKLQGQSTTVSGSQVQVKADAGLKLEASGITEVKGSMVKIN